ncbi:recombinase family protein [Alicyclobacillus dauci]|uniref:Recombinase family protein n=1 Tax=Alicyclobacillus dauci TaxID=1475485 RepID=A0ABY6Z5I2_9BACL|nr:recombinase family protein [Alicyclobacillus dauci]WAH38153.1 recombinase family protein [Alicyclobacillus dauci]
MTVCAIYARVSDESQLVGDSIEHQIGYCREHVRRRGLDDGMEWLTPEQFIYVDRGITGTSMLKRTAVQQLLRDARSNLFQVVLFKGISRFARDTVDALLMLRTLLACGVRVISMEENFDSLRDHAEFIFTIHSALAQAESEKTAIRVRVGAAQKAKSGKWNGQVPDGYVLNKVTKHLEIDRSTASIIRDIFSMYLNGMGCRTIADVLNREGRYTKRGNLWTQRNLSRLLRNPVYAGDVVFGRREKRQALPSESDPLARRKVTVRTNDPERLTVCRNAHPGIVSRAVFDKVQAIMDRRRSTSGPTENTHLFTKGLLKCTCGSSMTITYNRAGTAYYRCLRQGDAGRATCNSGYIRALDLERAVLYQVRADLLLALPFQDLVMPGHQVGDLKRELSEIELNIKRQLGRSQALFEQFTDGLLLFDQYEQMSEIVRRRVMSLQSTRDKLLTQIAVTAEPKEVEPFVRKAIADLFQVTTRNPRQTREILALFLEAVQVERSVDSRKEVRLIYRFAKLI